MNTAVHEAIKATPYEVVFGQPPRNNIFPGATGVVKEEDVGELWKGASDIHAHSMHILDLIIDAC